MGGDQNGSWSLSAWRRTSKKADVITTQAVPSHKPAKASRGFHVKAQPHRRRRQAQHARQQHDGGQRPAVDRGTFHQQADGLQILFSQIWIHAFHFAMQSRLFQSVFYGRGGRSRQPLPGYSPAGLADAGKTAKPVIYVSKTWR